MFVQRTERGGPGLAITHQFRAHHPLIRHAAAERSSAEHGLPVVQEQQTVRQDIVVALLVAGVGTVQ